MQACLKGTGLCTGHSTVVDGITPYKSPLFTRGRNVVMEVILLHFQVRPFCVVVSSLPWNRRSRVRISGLELTRHSALHYSLSMLSIRALSSKYIQWRIQDFLARAPSPKGAPSYYSKYFHEKWIKTKKKLGRGVCRLHKFSNLNPPL